MKITFLVSSLQFGGAERVATTLCNAWAQRGHHVSLIATYSGTDPSYFKLDPAVQLSYLADPQSGLFGRSRRSLPRLYKLRQILAKQQPDIVVSFLPSANVILFRVICLANLCHRPNYYSGSSLSISLVNLLPPEFIAVAANSAGKALAI